MKYPYSNEKIRRGDQCLFVYYASRLGDFDKPNDDLKELGGWLQGSNEPILIPSRIEDIRDGYIIVRFYVFKDNKWQILHINNDKNLCLEIKDDDSVTTRLIPYIWHDFSEWCYD